MTIQRTKTTPHPTPKLILGALYFTPGAAKEIARAGQSPLDFLIRHISGDWGDLGDEDIATNQHAVEHGERVLSAYKTLLGERIWIITEWDRSCTTILLPSDY